jgi:choline dehydrogenase-like flavoprotein
MLIDVNELPENSQIDCDICIAGSGPAGITIAAELVDAPVRVCLVESGGLSPRAAVPAGNVAEQLGISVDLLKFQHLSFGGASNRWGGLRGRWFRLRPMDPLDFETRPWVANSGWPFDYAELEPFYARAGRILKVSADNDFSVVARHAHLAPAFHNDDLHTAIFLMTRPLRFGQHYLDLLTRSPNVQVYLNGRVVEIEEDPNSPIVRCLHIVTPGERAHRITAKHFVIACGGLENTRLLLTSKRKMACGIGNQRDLVGRYYMQHPRGLHGAAVLVRNHLCTPLYTGGYVSNDMATGAQPLHHAPAAVRHFRELCLSGLSGRRTSMVSCRSSFRRTWRAPEACQLRGSGAQAGRRGLRLTHDFRCPEPDGADTEA